MNITTFAYGSYFKLHTRLILQTSYSKMIFTSLSCGLLGILVALIVIVIFQYKRSLTYWKRKGLDGPTPSFPFGNAKDVVFGKKSIGQFWKDIYFDMKAKGLQQGGAYFFAKPIFVPVDLESVKSILQVDFSHFNSHGTYHNEKDVLSNHIFNFESYKWRNARLNLTPTFSSGKMKMMFPTLFENTIQLKELLENCSNPVDIHDVIGRFTTDVIGSVAFGIEIDSMKNENAEFRKYGKMVFDKTLPETIVAISMTFIPHWILRALNVTSNREVVRTFFRSSVRDTIKFREQYRIERKDFLHFMMKLKKDVVQNSEPMTDDDIVSQSFLFFLAGFETASTTISFATYELAVNYDIQEKARKEVNRVLAKYDNEITYEAIMEMKYLDNVVCETLRKYPPLPFLFRKCVKNFVIPGTDIEIEEDTSVQIPVLGIHYDPEYYPNPEKFDPNRFTEEIKQTRPQYTWLPFGEGPRICLGQRFGMMQTKVGLVTILRNFELSVSKKMGIPVLNPKAVVTSFLEGIWIDLKKIRS